LGNSIVLAVSINKGSDLMDINNYTTEDFVCDESFRQYCTGSNPTVVAFWEDWIGSHPQMVDEIQEAKQLITILNARQGNVQEQLRQLKDGIDRFDLFKETLTAKSSPSPFAKRTTIPWKYAAGFAASLLVVAVAIYFLSSHKTAGPSAEVAAVAPLRIQSGDEPRKTVVLPDGSVVTLHSHSTITLAGQFGQSSRELVLSGEALFDIAHNEHHPFIVHTADVNVEVLGTLFNVSAYADGGFTETSLFRGKVSVSIKDHPEQKVILMPSQKLVIAHGAGKGNLPVAESLLKKIPLAVDPVDHKAKEIAWVRNRIKIEDEPLETIAAKLQAWYGIPIVFTDEEVKKLRYSGTFESETVVKALEALQLSYPFNFRVENERIVIGK
jgi:transmembrane sensor